VSAAVTCSPLAMSASVSRSSGRARPRLGAAARSRFVSPAMADTTATTSCPPPRPRDAADDVADAVDVATTDVPPILLDDQHAGSTSKIGKDT
jgi:hypothetical protein